MGDDNRRGARYEYRYSFDTDNKILSHDAILHYRTILDRGGSVFLFDVKTNFLLKRTRMIGVDDNKDETVMSSEIYNTYADSQHEYMLEIGMRSRLKEYWMSDDEIRKLSHQAFEFGTKQLTSAPRLIPLIVGLDVCTVQKEGEELEAAMERAIKAEHLVPLSCKSFTLKHNFFFVLFVRNQLPRIRVEDVDEGLGLMEICPICLCNPNVGAQISQMPSCSHAFHTHCIVRWLMKTNACPLCRRQAYKPFLRRVKNSP